MAATSLRKTVRGLRDDIWAFRSGEDAYTHLTQAQIKREDQNIDHVLEIQLVTYATAEPLKNNEELAKRMRDLVNEPYNLNVTSKRVNQAKRGPFTAAINRMKKRDGTLREISVEQLARSGRAKRLVDDGTWANVEKEVVVSYDALSSRASESRLTRKQSILLEETIDRLHDVLEKIKIL
jgi:hypothetical protein